MIRIQTLGALRARGPSGEVRVGRKELALLAYLARRSPQPVPRAELAALLWGERRDAQARQSLRQALVRLKHAVDLPLDVQAESVALLPGEWELDVTAFEADLAAGRLREAVARWEGDFLSGTEDVGAEGYRQWVEVEREALRQRVGRALEQLVAEAERAADWRAAVEWAERWAAASPLEERVHRRLIEVLRLAGRPEDALAKHAAFVARLRAELGIEPSPETLRLGAELAQQAPAARRARPSPGSRALFTPDFVGRAMALGELSACWTAVRAGTGAAVLVDGDEGIGKTRLCEEFLRSVMLAGDAAVVLRARGYEAGRDVPWAVARELLAPLKDAPGVPGASPGALAGLGHLIPAIRERFPAPPAVGQGEWLPDEAVAEALGAAAAESPVVIFVDDIPSADTATQQLITSLTRRCLGMRVLLLLAARADDLERSASLAELRAAHGVHRLRLQPLRETDVEALLGSMLDLPAEDRRRLSERLLAESGGNPFQIIQVTAALLDDGHLAPDLGGTWRLAAMPADQPLPVPASVREAVGRRLTRLSDSARRVAEAAAVLAGPASRELLRAVSGLSTADFDGALDELVGRRLLHAAPGSGHSYEFTHEITRRIVYDLLQPRERQALHAAALTSLPALRTRDEAARAARQYHRARAGSAAWPLPAWVRARPARIIVGALLAGGGIAVAVTTRGPAERSTVLAVGAIRDHTGADSAGLTRPLADLLATNLVRVPGVQVVSTARLYELMAQLGSITDTGAAIVRAARQAGATEVVEGALYRNPDGALRLDLRRVDLSGGRVRGAYSSQGAHPFALVDNATSELARALDIRVPALRVTDVTTASLVAQRFYEEGLRVYQNDARSAQRLFEAALAEDSTFAMAAYYVAMCQIALGHDTPRAPLILAARLAERATERERLLIRTTFAFMAHEPSQLAMAESLATRYPADPDGHLLVAHALAGTGDFLGALPHLRRVIVMDSLAFRGGAVRCRACDALFAMSSVYQWADSLAAAERIAREAITRSPTPARWRVELAGILDRQGRADEALAALRETPGIGDPAMFRAAVAIRAGNFAEADRLLNDVLRAGAAELQGGALWFLSISLRYQGRPAEARAVARRLRRLAERSRQDTVSVEAQIEAQTLFEMGRHREAVVLLDSVSRLLTDPDFPARTARNRTWALTHMVTSLAVAGDTAMLAPLADSIETYGGQSAYGRDPRLHHHVRGLLWRARGRLPEAEREFRRAIYSPNMGYTRTNLELGRVLLELNRPREAIAAVAPALRGPLDASNLYVTHTELHELLAQAYEAAGRADSAAAHYRWVVNAWRAADPQFRARWERARQRIAALER